MRKFKTPILFGLTEKKSKRLIIWALSISFIIGFLIGIALAMKDSGC